MSPDEINKTQHLVALAKGGDPSALNQLCSIYGERVRRIIRLRMDRKLRPKLDSVDVVQDALMLALGGLKGFTYKNEGDFLRWLTRIAENRLCDVLDTFHAAKRDVRKEIPFKKGRPSTQGEFKGPADPVGMTTPSVVVTRKEEFDALEKALDALSPELRDVIILTRIEGLSYKEVGERLGKSGDAVRRLVLRAMAVLTSVFEYDQ